MSARKDSAGKHQKNASKTQSSKESRELNTIINELNQTITRLNSVVSKSTDNPNIESKIQVSSANTSVKKTITTDHSKQAKQKAIQKLTLASVKIPNTVH